jgi:TusA-related sulfurtransferase
MNLETIKVDYSVDARGSSCPGPILEAKKGISKVKKDQVLEILATDPGTKNDLPIWIKRVGHEFLGVIEGEGYFRMLIRRKK